MSQNKKGIPPSGEIQEILKVFPNLNQALDYFQIFFSRKYLQGTGFMNLYFY